MQNCFFRTPLCIYNNASLKKNKESQNYQYANLSKLISKNAFEFRPRKLMAKFFSG